jgi:hypothetical protein
MCSYCNYRFVLMKICCGFWTIDLIFLLMTLFWLFVVLIELLGLQMLSFIVYESLVVGE